MRFRVIAGRGRLAAPLMVALLVLGATTGTTAAGKTARSVGAGWQHACAVRSDATAWCWGSNVHGELGDGQGAGNESAVPVQVVMDGGDPLTKVAVVASGREHSCAIRTDKTAWCWGQAAEGEVGDGTEGDALGYRLQAVEVQTGAGALENVTAISAGTEFTCAIKGDKTVWCWGSDYYGQLGDGTTGDANLERLLPVQVVGVSGALMDVTAISAGWQHACAVRTDGTAWCWGLGSVGQLGNGTTPHYVTHAVQVLKGTGVLTKVRSVSAGNGHTCAVRTDGTAWCWGLNDFGQVGDGTVGTTRTKPVQVVKGSGKLTGVKSISATAGYGAAGFTCAAVDAGTAWCWGAAASGQVGDGTTGGPQHRRAKPVQVVKGSGKFTGVKSISAGGAFACAVRTDGTAWCWGSDNFGQLGDHSPLNTNIVRLKPVKVRLPV